MQTYTVEQAKEQLSEYPEWFIDEEKGKIYTGFEFDEFDQAIDFVNAVAELASEAGQNPDLYLYDSRYLQIFISMVDDKYTEAGFELLEAIDELFSEMEEGFREETDAEEESDEEEDHTGHNHE